MREPPPSTLGNLSSSMLMVNSIVTELRNGNFREYALEYLNPTESDKGAKNGLITALSVNHQSTTTRFEPY